ncbi:MAG TPA: hypothetical protein VKU01_04160 [Bryobacteraceae bacterium]|nr:hypothetical protein [Bryobacteraceae bacterium]
MRESKFPQDRPSGRREPNPDLTFIFAPGVSFNGAGLFHPVHELDSTVMLSKQSRGNFADGRLYAFRQPVYGKQELMLLRLKAMLFGSRFAEMKESANLPAKLG